MGTLQTNPLDNPKSHFKCELLPPAKFLLNMQKTAVQGPEWISESARGGNCKWHSHPPLLAMERNKFSKSSLDLQVLIIYCYLTSYTKTYGLKQQFIVLFHSVVGWLGSPWGLSCNRSQREAAWLRLHLSEGSVELEHHTAAVGADRWELCWAALLRTCSWPSHAT